MGTKTKRKWWQITVGEEQRRRFNKIAEFDHRNYSATFEMIVTEALEKRRLLEVDRGKPNM